MPQWFDYCEIVCADMPTKDELLTEFPSIARLEFGYEFQLSRQLNHEGGWEEFRLGVSEESVGLWKPST